MHNLAVAASLSVAMALSLGPEAFAAEKTGGRAAGGSVWKHADCGPYGHRGPWGGCIPGGEFGAGNYWFLGPPYTGPRPFFGPPFYGESPPAAAQHDYGPAYWGARPYGVPAFW
jgi:hypothetical protein